MQEDSIGDPEGIERAVAAAEQVFDKQPAAYEPADVREAWAAVRRLGELFDELPGAIAEALDSGRGSGSLLSSDRLQGLAEIIQNADDVQASEVRFLLTPTELLASHNGAPVRLGDVLGLATPWLSTKADDAGAIGRFGVGLSTLRSLSQTLEVHCAPYHVRIGDPAIAPIELPDLPSGFREPGWTTLRVPLQDGTLKQPELEDWLDRWDDSSLLFLRHVTAVVLLDLSGLPTRRLALSRRSDPDLVSTSGSAAVSRVLVEAADGRSWAVYGADAVTPEGVTRARKATETTTPVAVALPLGAIESGQIHAGLPVARTRLPLFANAQFDPLTSREGFADKPWNKALVNLVAEVWSEAVLDLFGRDPHAAWQAMPLPCARDEEAASGVVGDLEAAVLEKARQQVARRLSFPVPDQGHVRLSHLAVEARPLEGVLEEAEIAELAGLSATLPIDVRDPGGRWRSVLKDWRRHGADLPKPVSVARALDLVGDEDRPVGSTIALVAAALQEDLGAHLRRLPCVITHDGRRMRPPAGDSTAAVSVETMPLAEQLGISTLLHPAHRSGENGAPEVLAWLGECGALLDGSDDHEVLRRLAKAGRSDRYIQSPLTDEQANALREAFEHLDQKERNKLGPDVGRAIRLASYTYDAAGRKIPGSARPFEAYLPRAIDRDRDSFAVAAGKAQGLTWMSDRYATTLRSQVGRQGIGPQQFLRLLRVETAPRLQPHPQLIRRYERDRRRGLYRVVANGPEARIVAMKAQGAEYTLEDHDSPDLLAVIKDISLERSSQRRRERARALLAALDRAWDRHFNECAEVEAVEAYHSWHSKGKITAFWLAQAGDVTWLDDESGATRKPTALRVRTPGNEAIYGPSKSNYLHADLDQPIRRQLLKTLGVSIDPKRSELVERLKELRRASDKGDITSEDLRGVSALIYRALSQSLSGASNDSDLSAPRLRREFESHQLVFTNMDWQSPLGVLTGPPIFGKHRAFVPPVPKCDQLWYTLGLRKPSQNDCLEVLRKVARRRTHAPDLTEEAILLDTLRALSDHYVSGNKVERRKLAHLSLWTSKGWTRDRPVYATDDPVLTAGLGDALPIWQPGGKLEQFRALFEPLRVKEIRTKGAEVIDPKLAVEDHDLTELFQRALGLLRDDLLRNDRELAKRVTVPWADLEDYVVKVHPSLTLGIDVASGQQYHCEANAKVDAARATVFVRKGETLARVDGGGRALAALFEGDERLVAQAWRVACDCAEERIEARHLELAEERAANEAAELDDEELLAKFRERPVQTHSSSRPSTERPVGGVRPSHAAAGQTERQEQPSPAPASRTLVDPQSLRLVDPEGRMNKSSLNAVSGTASLASIRRGLNEPKGGSSVPQNRTARREYSDLDRENVGLELLKRLLSLDDDKIVDLRTQRGVGADAMDEMENYYELKVSAGPEPDSVTLTDSEVQRAISTDQFFLVVVSNVEESDAHPTIRVIEHPLRNTIPTVRGTVALRGVHKAKSLVYEFAPIDDQSSTDEISSQEV